MQTKEKKQNRFIGMFPFEFDDSSAAKTVAIPDAVHLIPIGQWEHDMYGPILITNNDIREFKMNFDARIRKGVYITAGHEGCEEYPAQGWITAVEMRDNGLWGSVEWNELGKQTLSDKQYKFISPEFYTMYEDPQTHEIYRNVLIGAALTKSPYFKELEAVIFSDKNIKNKFNENKNNNMNLTDLIAKDIATLTDEEKAFIKDNSADLTDEQKETYAAIIEVKEEEKTEETSTETEKTEEEAPADEEKVEEETPAEETPAEEPAPEEGTEKVEASEKNKSVMISASELATLKDNAAKGELAFKELRTAKLDAEIKAMTFNSETNPVGRFLPKSADILRSFMESLDDKQLLSFKSIVTQLPKTATIFSEDGAEDGAEGTAVNEMEAKVSAVLKANDKLTYGDALKLVMSENKGLGERYEKELGQ